MTGTIPTQLGLPNLWLLALSDNQLTGGLSSELGQLNSSNPYTSIYLEFNTFVGTIPSEFGLVPNLEELSLHGNQLTGSIPNEIANHPNMIYLRLDGNELTGDIPVFDSVMNGFFDTAEEWFPDRTFNLSDNAFTGVVPVELCRLEAEGQLQFDCSEDLCGCSCACTEANFTTPVANDTLFFDNVTDTDESDV